MTLTIRVLLCVGVVYQALKLGNKLIPSESIYHRPYRVVLNNDHLLHIARFFTKDLQRIMNLWLFLVVTAAAFESQHLTFMAAIPVILISDWISTKNRKIQHQGLLFFVHMVNSTLGTAPLLYGVLNL